MRRGTASFETTISFNEAGEWDIPVNVEVKINGDDFEIGDVTRTDSGDIVVLTSDLVNELTEEAGEHWDELLAELEGAYADYRYEQWRDDRMMEKWDD